MTLQDLLDEYQELPEYLGLKLVDVNQISLFGDRPLHVAATRGSVPEMRLLVSAGADVNAKGEHGYTPLHCAVEQGKVEAVLWLLKNGADRTVANEKGETAAQLADLFAQHELRKIIEAFH